MFWRKLVPRADTEYSCSIVSYISITFSAALKDLKLELFEEQVLEENARSVSAFQDNDLDS